MKRIKSVIYALLLEYMENVLQYYGVGKMRPVRLRLIRASD